MLTCSFTITPKAPYSFDRTVARFSRFDSEIVDCVDGNQYRRLLTAGRQLSLATVISTGTVTKPQLTIELTSPSKTTLKKSTLEAQLRHILCTDFDLKPFYRLARKDDLLAPLISSFRGLQVPSSPTIFETLVVAVLAQQVNLTFAYSIKKELVEVYGRKWKHHDHTYYAFPEPARFAKESAESLRRFRLSTAKAGTLVRLGEAFASGTLDQDELAMLPDEGAIERLTRIKGIGRWTAETALLRGLARSDAFPGGDLGVVKYLAQGMLGKKAKARESEMRDFAERWRPYRGLALAYCYVELARRQAKRK